VLDGIPAAAPRARELWLCLHFPRFALDTLVPGAGAAPVAVLDDAGRVLIACSPGAERAGIHAGMGLNAALALLPGLTVHARDAAHEQRLLVRLGSWLTQFTPLVSLEPPDAVFAEVRGSLRLFGGARALQARIRQRLDEQGYRPALALTPTPQASLAAARAGLDVRIASPAALPRLAARLPLASLGLPARVQESLASLGLRSVADLLRLPRDGFARRFGPARLDQLDSFLGRRAEPRARVIVPERFEAGLELPAECVDVERLLLAAALLLERLEGFLRSRGAGITGLRLCCHHGGGCRPTFATLRLQQPAATAVELSPLLRERLARLPLPAPVRALGLRSTVAVPLAFTSAPLWRHEHAAADVAAAARLVDRLRARLGEEAVFGLRALDEHRPERAWAFAEAVNRPTAEPALPAAPRPLWLLAAPQLLGVREGRPCYRGGLELVSGPERIETGWWDGDDVRRDYYVARNREGLGLWIYRERGAGGRWHLHGLFG
jgi:protein ImuB